jgi:hypothetical protein
MRNVFLYWVGKDYKVIRRLRKLIYMHSMFGTAYTVHLINDKNVQTYISDLPPSFSKLKPAHQADYVRVYTVCKYGGIWLDADTIVMESLDPLFKLLEESDGFFIRQNNEGLCNGVFGSRAGTTVMTKWLAAIDERLAVKGKLEFTELGAAFLNKTLEESPQDFRNYTLFNGLDNMYPVNWDKCLEEYVEKPYENYKTLIRPFQPLVILVNSVYTKLESKTDREIDEAQIPLNYFLNKSYSNGLKAYAFLVLLIGCALAFLAFVAFLVYAYTMDPVPSRIKLSHRQRRWLY